MFPFNGECLLNGIYKATIQNGNETIRYWLHKYFEKYFGSTGVSFKTMYTQHKHSFKSINSSQTTLSKYVKKSGKNDIIITWSIINKIFRGVAQKPYMC